MALTDSLIAHWKMEEDGTASRVDSHGSYDLPYYTGGPGRVAGKFNYAVAFDDGASQYYLRTASSPGEAFYPSTGYTIAAWVYRGNDWQQSPAGYGSLFWLQGTYLPFEIYTLYSSGYVHRFRHQISTSSYIYVEVASALQAWEFVVGRWNGSTVSISVNNGTPDTDTAATLVAYADAVVTDLRCGRRYPSDEVYYVDSMSFWHRALSDAEVTTLYNSGDGLDYPFTESSKIGKTSPYPMFYRD